MYGKKKRKFCCYLYYKEFYLKEVHEAEKAEQTIYYYCCREYGRDFSSYRKGRIYCSKKCSTTYKIKKKK